MKLSDKALSILAFAAYHQLESGDVVSEVVLDDGQGHQANEEGVAELEQAGLLEAGASRGKFTDQGAQKLASVIEAIRS